VKVIRTLTISDVVATTNLVNVFILLRSLDSLLLLIRDMDNPFEFGAHTYAGVDDNPAGNSLLFLKFS